MTQPIKVWTDEQALRFIEKSIGNLRPRKIVIRTLVQNGILIPKAEKLYKDCLEDLNPEDNVTTRNAIRLNLSGLLETIDEALEAAVEREDFIAQQQLLKLKTKTLLDYAAQFTSKEVDVPLEADEQAAVLQLRKLFGSSEG
jgi:hypothetical protein